MTDARLPEKWLSDRRLSRLSDEHFRAYMQALLFSVSNRTDGVIEPEDIELIPHFATGAVNAFLANGLWTGRDHGWLITDFKATQTTRHELEVLENARARERRKKQRQRSKAADEDSGGESAVPGDSPGGQAPGTAQAGRQGKAGQESTGTSNGQPSTTDGSGGTGAVEDSATAAHASTNGWPQWRGQGPSPYEEYR